ncbi:DUF2399 domain-containing protein [Streptomyces misionensis]|uniref:DUF2399 domain-containing protein n=1 Tax=Streptomyces misionensis TaxID=67331 RepID=UPI0036846174
MPRICARPVRAHARRAAGLDVHALVCTSGNATTVVLTLLDALSATGCRQAHQPDLSTLACGCRLVSSSFVTASVSAKASV